MTAPTRVTNGQLSDVSQLNQYGDRCNRQSGQQETGHYWIIGFGTTSSQTIGVYVPSLSRDTAPVSVTIDTADQSPVSVNSPTVQGSTSGGFNVDTTTTTTTNTGRCGGNYTIQY